MTDEMTASSRPMSTTAYLASRTSRHTAPRTTRAVTPTLPASDADDYTTAPLLTPPPPLLPARLESLLDEQVETGGHIIELDDGLEIAQPEEERTFDGMLRRLLTEGQRVERGKSELQQLMLLANQVNPEREAMHRAELERRDTEIKNLQRELTALRRATAVIGQTATSGFWRRMGEAMDRDCEILNDHLASGDKEAALEAARVMGKTLGEFAGHCQVYADVLH